MHVIAHRSQIPSATAIHNQRLVSAGKEMAAELMPDIKALGVNAQEPLHAGDQIGLRSFEHQMKMIAHQTIGVNLPLSFGASFPSFGQKTTAGSVLSHKN